jgi:hypothetical protein
MLQQSVGKCQVAAHIARAEDSMLGNKRSCWVLQNGREVE